MEINIGEIVDVIGFAILISFTIVIVSVALFAQGSIHILLRAK